jgi:hypothetical protein
MLQILIYQAYAATRRVSGFSVVISRTLPALMSTAEVPEGWDAAVIPE